MSEQYDKFMKIAIEEANKGNIEGGIPIGSCLVIDNKVIGKGYNKRIQNNSSILHAEMDCLENAGRLSPSSYYNSTIYTTLSPCFMCTGAILLYGIKKVVIGENENFVGGEDLLKENKVEVINLNNKYCKKMMKDFIEQNPKIWNEDIGIE